MQLKLIKLPIVAVLGAAECVPLLAGGEDCASLGTYKVEAVLLSRVAPPSLDFELLGGVLLVFLSENGLAITFSNR